MRLACPEIARTRPCVRCPAPISAVEIIHLAGRCGRKDLLRHRFGEKTEPLARFAHLLLAPFSFRDVAGHGGEVGRFARRRVVRVLPGARRDLAAWKSRGLELREHTHRRREFVVVCPRSLSLARVSLPQELPPDSIAGLEHSGFDTFTGVQR